MLSVVGFTAPHIDYHALAPEIILAGTLIVVLIVDLASERNRALLGTIAGIGLLAAMLPVITLAVDGTDRFVLSGNPGYVVDNFALTMKALFIIAGYVVVLLSTNYVAEGDYYEGEYYFLLLTSVLGMVVMASSRDLISIFIALETLSIPAYMLATWRKRDPKSNEAGLKYYLMGVFATAIMLYGMSLIFGVSGTTVLADISASFAAQGTKPIITLGIVFCVVGFAFKVSAVPFHTWAPDTYEGAPTPITAFLSVSSKAGGFVAILTLIFVGFFGQHDVWEPMMWALAVMTMTVGNLVALRQTNLVRLFAYSSIAQAGYILAPLAVAGELSTAQDSLSAVIIYLLIYAAMNLGAFGVIIAVARKTRSAELDSFNGLFEYAPGLTVVMTVFLFALAGIPPLAGWFAKFEIFRATANAGTAAGYTLAVFVGVNSVIALFYYARVAQAMWMQPAPDGDRSPIRVPPALTGALAICVIAVVVVGVYPQLVAKVGDMATFALTSASEANVGAIVGLWPHDRPGVRRRRRGMNELEQRVADEIRRRGPVPFSEVMDLALYDAEHGFYAAGGAAGRRGDFITSPEVGPLFGAVVAGALDEWWRKWGEPDPFVVIEAGAGVGTLALSVLAAQPACAAALRYVLVERSASLRAGQADHLALEDPALAFAPDRAEDEDGDIRAPEVATGPIVVSLDSMPRLHGRSIVLANELLDNLAVDLLERHDGRWYEVRVGLDDDRLVETLVPSDGFEVDVPDGARIPVQKAALRWVRDARECGAVLTFDYADTTASMATREAGEWLRTYRGHQRGGAPLQALGTQDITCEVAVDQLPAPSRTTQQADWLRAHGIDELVDEGRRIWEERKHIADLEAMRARSRINEAAALLDPDGLGGFCVLEWD